MVLLWVLGELSFDAFQSYIEELATTEGRVAVSVLVLVVALLLIAVVAPVTIRRIGQLIRTQFLNKEAVAVIDVINGYLPTRISTLVSGAFQIIILFVAIVSLLIVWGLIDVAITIIEFVGVSVPFIGRFLTTMALLILAYIAFDILGDAIREFSQEADRVTKHQEEIVLRLGNVAILALLITATLTLWGLDISGLLVGAGFAGIVLGLAAQQTLGSMIAGFVLMFSRPFIIGDWVQIGEDEGVVTKITIMHTRLRNFDGESIVIPNDVVGNKPVVNRTKQGTLRTRIDVGVDYETDPEYAEEIALETMKELEAVVDSPPPQVVPKTFGDSAVVLELRFWIDNPLPPRRWEATRQVIHSVKRRFEAEDIKIPYPQRELSGRQETGGFRVNSAVSQSRAERTSEALQTDSDNTASGEGDSANSESDSDSTESDKGAQENTEAEGSTEETSDSEPVGE